MLRLTISAVLLTLLAPLAGFGDEAPKETDIAKAELVLPRFRVDKTKFSQHPGLEEALKGVPSLKAEDSLFEFGGFMTRVTFNPAKSDIGDIAKAVAKVPATNEEKKEAPAAVLLVFTAVSLERKERAFTEEQSVKAWKALEAIAGIDLPASKKRTGAGRVFHIVLDDKGGARLAPIVEAIKSAGIEFQPR